MADFSGIDWFTLVNTLIALVGAAGFLKNKSTLDQRAGAVKTIKTVAAGMDVVSGGLSKVAVLVRDITDAQDESSPGGVSITPEEWKQMSADLAGVIGDADAVKVSLQKLKA